MSTRRGGPGGGGGVMGASGEWLMIDQCIPTMREITERKADLVVKLQEERRFIIFENACA